MVPAGWSARGDSNPDLHGLNVPRLPIAPRADMVTTGGFEPPLDRLSTCCLCRLGYMAIGPSGWTRTTTTRVKSPACCVDTTEGVELIPGIEPRRRPYQGRRLPLHQISSGANDGIRTRTSRLGRPVGDRYPTFALVRLRVSNPHPPHPGRTWTGAAHRPIDIVSIFKDPTLDELLPLHHAADVASRLDGFEDTTSL